jgi:hypothetical protein
VRADRAIAVAAMGNALESSEILKIRAVALIASGLLRPNGHDLRSFICERMV